MSVTDEEKGQALFYMHHEVAKAVIWKKTAYRPSRSV